MDLQGAYDNVNLEVLCKLLTKFKIPDSIIRFIFNIINDRILHGIFNGFELDCRRTNKGLPQGSNLSPLLFNIYISEINSYVDYGCKLLTFADDILIYCKNSNTDVILNCLNKSATQISNWLRDLSLSISFDKSRFIMFSQNFKDVKVKIKNDSLDFRYFELNL